MITPSGSLGRSIPGRLDQSYLGLVLQVREYIVDFPGFHPHKELQVALIFDVTV